MTIEDKINIVEVFSDVTLEISQYFDIFFQKVKYGSETSIKEENQIISFIKQFGDKISKDIVVFKIISKFPVNNDSSGYNFSSYQNNINDINSNDEIKIGHVYFSIVFTDKIKKADKPGKNMAPKTSGFSKFVKKFRNF